MNIAIIALLVLSFIPYIVCKIKGIETWTGGNYPDPWLDGESEPEMWFKGWKFADWIRGNW